MWHVWITSLSKVWGRSAVHGEYMNTCIMMLDHYVFTMHVAYYIMLWRAHVHVLLLKLFFELFRFTLKASQLRHEERVTYPVLGRPILTSCFCHYLLAQNSDSGTLSSTNAVVAKICFGTTVGWGYRFYCIWSWLTIDRIILRAFCERMWPSVAVFRFVSCGFNAMFVMWSCFNRSLSHGCNVFRALFYRNMTLTSAFSLKY